MGVLKRAVFLIYDMPRSIIQETIKQMPPGTAVSGSLCMTSSGDNRHPALVTDPGVQEVCKGVCCIFACRGHCNHHHPWLLYPGSESKGLMGTGGGGDSVKII